MNNFKIALKIEKKTALGYVTIEGVLYSFKEYEKIKGESIEDIRAIDKIKKIFNGRIL